jgi:MFS family permease
MHAAPAVGALLGSTALGSLGVGRRPIAAILASLVGYGLFAIGFGVSPLFPVSLLMLCGLGATDVVATVMRQTVVQLRTPDEVRGRVTAIAGIFSQGGPSLGQVAVGLLASLLGPAAAVVLGGCGVLAAVAGFSSVPVVRHSLGHDGTESVRPAPSS